jgi:hypothetical protein
VDGKPTPKLPSLNIPDDFATNEGVDGYLKTYDSMLETHKEVYKAVFEKLKEVGAGGVLFHCSGSSSPFTTPC